VLIPNLASWLSERLHTTAPSTCRLQLYMFIDVIEQSKTYVHVRALFVRLAWFNDFMSLHIFHYQFWLSRNCHLLNHFNQCHISYLIWHYSGPLSRSHPSSEKKL
jgi:hypothetical protein